MIPVSVVVLTCNRRHEVLATLAALQELESQYPVVVVDNGSSDGTAAAVKQDFPGVGLIEPGRNLGAAGRNLGVEMIRTPYVAFSDDDTHWAHGALHKASEILAQAPTVGVVNARVLVGERARLDPTSAAMAASPLAPTTPFGVDIAGFMAGACVMRKTAFLQAGGYWRPFGIGGEETLLALDLLHAGWRMIYVDEIVTRHFPSANRDRDGRRHALARNAVWTAALRLPWSEVRSQFAQAWRQCDGSHDRLRLLQDLALGAPLVLRERRPISAEVVSLWKEGRQSRPQ